MEGREGRLSRARRGASLLAIAASAAAATAAVATAGSASDRITIPAQARGIATAECKQGTTAVAGGFEAPGFNPRDEGPAAARLTSRLKGTRRITAEAFNFGREPADFVSLAYCAKHRRGLTVRSNKAFLGPHSPGSVVARCRGGTRVVGGGFGTQGFSQRTGPRVITFTSRRAGARQWRAEAMNLGGESADGGRAGTLIAYAYCQTDPPKLLTASERVEIPAGEMRSVDAECPDGARAHAGGFDGNIRLTSEPSASAAVTSKRVERGRTWHVEALNISDSAPAQVTAHAYCRR
jgi:hypothetical protein